MYHWCLKMIIVSFFTQCILSDKYLLVVLKLLGNPCSCYNNNCITKLWAPAITFSIYTWFLDTFSHYFIEQCQCYFNHSKLKFIIPNLYEHFKVIDLNSQLNSFESFITHYSLDSYVSCHPSLKSVLSVLKYYHNIY